MSISMAKGLIEHVLLYDLSLVCSGHKLFRHAGMFMFLSQHVLCLVKQERQTSALISDK